MEMCVRFSLAAVLLGAVGISPQSAAAQDSLWIATGTWEGVSEETPIIRLVSDTAATISNAVIQRPAATESWLTVFNLDSVPHHWFMDGMEGESIEILAYSETEIALPALPQGTYCYGLADELGKRLGGRGMVQVGLTPEANSGFPLFHWNLNDWSTPDMQALAAGVSLDPSSPYVPDRFTINERTYPATAEDAFAVVQLNMGDTCWIAIANHGLMDHVLHFHGFHVTLLTSTHHPERIGWSKDTVPVLRGEGLTVQLVANQSGTYPVHDHNLIAVTNAGFYPGGMLTHINVAP